MLYTKTVRVPVHYGTTAKKFSYLDNLTARHTYAVRLWSDIIKRHGFKKREDVSLEFEHYIKNKTKLSAGFVQQSKDKALWMWSQYRTAHRKWRWRVKKAKTGTKYYEKLLQREPSEPFTNGKTLTHKIPIRFDKRTGTIEKSKVKMSDWIMRISTLKKNEKITVLLNSAKYHNELLGNGKIKDFEIVKRNGKYYAHVTCQYEVEDAKPTSLTAIDLGINRTVTAVLFSQSKKPKSIIVTDKDKQEKLQFYEDLFGELKRGRKWKKLTTLRNKKKNISVHYGWLTASKLASTLDGTVVVIGKLTHIRERQFKGNGNKGHRKRINKWAYCRISSNIMHKLAEKGMMSKQIFEGWTSRTCSNCGSTNTVRAVQEAIFCYDCMNGFDADKNACVNLSRKFLSKSAKAELAVTRDDLGLNPSLSLEATSLDSSEFREW